MEFSADQQTFIDELISKKYSEAYAKASAQYLSVDSKTVLDLKAELAKAHDRLRVATIEGAASAQGAVDSGQVASLLGGTVRVDETGGLFVVDSTGERRYDRSGAPLSVPGAVGDFLDANRHLLRARSSIGAGSQGCAHDAPPRVITRRDFDCLTPAMQMSKVMDGTRITD